LSAVAPAIAAPSPVNWPAGRMAGNWIIAIIAFLGAFVIDEPAPYELLLCPVILVWSFFGLRLNRHFAPMVGLMLCYVAGGFLSLTQLPDPTSGIVYMLTTTFLVLSSIFFAAVIAVAPEKRIRIIKNAYIAAAIIASLLGIAGYFHLFPGADIFLRYDRVKGTFQDPNVFGPFLVLPIVFLCQDLLTQRLHQSLGKIVLLLILVFAVFLAFSRAAWGMTVFALLLVAFLGFLNERRQMARFRTVAYFAAGAVVIALLVAVALSVPEVANLFKQRAQLVEDYDAGNLGRFARHELGFFLVQERPLGIGPLVFAKLFGEDEHNMWLKGFTTYGWLGGFAYITLVIWTIAAAGRLIFKPRPWTKYLHCVFAVYLGQVMIHNVIDNDHWRHLFLLYGMLWGMVAAEKMFVRDLRRAGARMAAAPPPMPSLAQEPIFERAPAPAAGRAI